MAFDRRRPSLAELLHRSPASCCDLAVRDAARLLRVRPALSCCSPARCSNPPLLMRADLSISSCRRTASRCGRPARAMRRGCCVVPAGRGARSTTARPRPAGPAAPRRRAGLQRHAGHPRALQGVRRAARAGRSVAANLHERVDAAAGAPSCGRPSGCSVGDRIRFGHDGRACLLGALDATVPAKGEAGEVELAFEPARRRPRRGDRGAGRLPLPPYIAAKRARRTTRTAPTTRPSMPRDDGAVAAPTAGLHFTPELLAALDARGVARHFVTLHVGAGTFLPVKADDTAEHQMHAEWGEVDRRRRRQRAQRRARRTAGASSRVGTTSLRLAGERRRARTASIAAVHRRDRHLHHARLPLPAVDALMTNFHLPRSTLFMLVSAFAGLETMRAAYAHAIARGYRFYSYGDACLLYPAPRPR